MVRHLPRFPVAVVRVQHSAQDCRGLRILEHCLLEAQVQAPHARVLACRAYPNPDDRVLRPRRNLGNV